MCQWLGQCCFGFVTALAAPVAPGGGRLKHRVAHGNRSMRTTTGDAMSNRHRKRVRHFESAVQFHELTFSCFQRRPLLTNQTWTAILAQSVSAACQEKCFDLVAFVFMPAHVHLLVVPATRGAKVSGLLARIKQPTSKRVRALIEADNSPLVDQLTVEERPGKKCFRFWLSGPGYDRNIFTSQALTASINYIHMNPVKRKLCQKAVDFKWSSARFHLDHLTESDLPRLTRLDSECFDRFGVRCEHG